MSFQARIDRFVAGCVARAQAAHSPPAAAVANDVGATDATLARLVAALPDRLKRLAVRPTEGFHVVTPAGAMLKVVIEGSGDQAMARLVLDAPTVIASLWQVELTGNGILTVACTRSGVHHTLFTKSPAGWVDLLDWAMRLWELGGGTQRMRSTLSRRLAIGAGGAGLVLVAMIAHGMWLTSKQEAAPAAVSAAAAPAAGAKAPVAPATAAATPNAAAVAPVSSEPTPGPSVSREDMREVEAIAKAGGIALRDKGTPLYVFSNPTCGACRYLDGQLDLLPQDVNPIIIPVGFDVESLRLATAALCVDKKDNGLRKNWQSLMTVGQITSSICQPGIDASTKSIKLFARLGFNATPTLLDSTGRTLVGGAEATSIARWVAQAR